jgi:uncharacterized protein YfaS (alpha-2-macroglobulin family)
MTLNNLLDAYHLARTRGSDAAKLAIADQLVDKEIPELIERLAQATLDRNRTQQEGATDADNLVDCHL